MPKWFDLSRSTAGVVPNRCSTAIVFSDMDIGNSYYGALLIGQVILGIYCLFPPVQSPSIRIFDEEIINDCYELCRFGTFFAAACGSDCIGDFYSPSSTFPWIRNCHWSVIA